MAYILHTGHNFWSKDDEMIAIPLKERRKLPRRSKDEPVRLRFEGGEVDAILHGISLAGMSILTQHPFEPGTWLVVEPTNPRRCFSPVLRAEVKYTINCDQEVYLVGCHFDRYLTIDDVMAFD